MKDDMRLQFPMGFGKSKNVQSLEQVHASTRRQVAPDLQAMVKEAEAASRGLHLSHKASEGASSLGQTGKDASESESEDDSEEDAPRKITDCVPCSHEAIMKGHSRAVSALTLDPAGARLISGGYDCTVRLWDFNGMDASLKSFREFTPWEGQQVKSVHYSITGDKFICATMKNQATIYNRDAVKEVEFAKGDMYVHDMGQTKGHVAALVCARWHPIDRASCLTAAIDGTVRLWDVTTCDKKQVTVLKGKNTKGQKAIPHAATYRPNGDIIAACDDGTIKVSSYSAPNPPRAVSPNLTHIVGMQSEQSASIFARHHSACIGATLQKVCAAVLVRNEKQPDPCSWAHAGCVSGLRA